MGKNTNIENSNWDLLAKYLTNEADENEKSILETWIGKSELNFREFKENQRLLEKIELYFQTNRFDELNAFKSVRAKISQSATKQNKHQQKTGRSIYFSFIKYAAIIVLAIALGTAGYYLGFRHQIPAGMHQIVSAEKQVLKEVLLPDGTLVTLNSNTEISFPDQFSGKTREVKIQGEAFFDVTPNPDKPFVIAAGEVQIIVLGTSFNVCAYPGSETIEVVVETGKVQVAEQSDFQNVKNNVLLDPGEKATLIKKGKVLQKKTNDDPNFSSWKTHDFVFNKSTLAYVIQNLEKTYFVEIQTSDPEIDNLVLTAQFNNKPIDFILEVIRLTFNLELSVDNNQYVLTSRNS